MATGLVWEWIKKRVNMPGLVPNVDPEGLLEYSVVYTDRSVNHMSESFQSVMRDISGTLCGVYNADSVAVVPGSGTFGMEAVARQFASARMYLYFEMGGLVTGGPKSKLETSPNRILSP